MAFDKSEERKFRLWSISRVNTPVAPGPGTIFPVKVVKNSSWHFLEASPAVGQFLEKTIPCTRTIGLFLAIVFTLTFFFFWISPDAVARRAISRAGGVANETYTSRFVFQDSNLQPADVMSLIPYFKNVPIANDLASMPKCVVLDFKATPRIDEKTILELVKHLKNTIVFYSPINGGRWRASDDMRQEMIQRANRFGLGLNILTYDKSLITSISGQPFNVPSTILFLPFCDRFSSWHRLQFQCND